ncbi:MAG: Hsp70 family protein [Hyphomicrobiales bacterium]|nr:Hsp70 family protein [Hyphomicrobiales bacterium]
MSNPTLSCGLDFGTSNSTLGTVGADGAPNLVPLEDGRPTIPSAIFFSFEDESVFFGRKALSEYVSGAGGRIMRSLKSVLGTSLMGDTTRIKARSWPFIDILGLYVGELKQRSETLLGRAIDNVVVGRPVHFVDDDQRADAEAQRQLEGAVRAKGFRHIEFQFEPIAAALDYERQIEDEQLALIVDIGGGTSDFSIIRVSPERARASDRQADILATTGVHIGGTDFDRMLSMAKVMPALGYQTPTRDGKRPLPSGPYYDLATWHRINRLYVPQTLLELRQTRREAKYPERVEQMLAVIEDRQGHRLASTVEDAKIALTAIAETEFSFTARDVALQTIITSADLGRAIENAVERLVATINATLQHAGLAASAIETLILTGGSTQIPAIMSRLHALFPEARFVQTDAFGSVGLGLALDASRKF